MRRSAGIKRNALTTGGGIWIRGEVGERTVVVDRQRRRGRARQSERIRHRQRYCATANSKRVHLRGCKRWHHPGETYRATDGPTVGDYRITTRAVRVRRSASAERDA